MNNQEQCQNVVKKLYRSILNSKKNVEITYSMSDTILQQFQGINQKIACIPILQLQLLSKQLDNQLPGLKKFISSLLSLDTYHSFLLFKTDNFMMTIDFYKRNRIIVTIGDQKTVLKIGISSNRQKSVIRKEKIGLQWKMPVEPGILYMKDIFTLIDQINLPQQHSEINYHGLHFSQNLWKQIQYKIKIKKQSDISFINL